MSIHGIAPLLMGWFCLLLFWLMAKRRKPKSLALPERFDPIPKIVLPVNQHKQGFE